MSNDECQDHGNLQSRLLFEEMSERERLRVEAVTERCPGCISARQAEVNQPHYKAVDAGVGAGIRDFRPPDASEREVFRELAAIAAMVVLVIGIMLLGERGDRSPVERSGASVEMDSVAESVGVDESLAIEGFEAANSTLSFVTGDAEVVRDGGVSFPAYLEPDHAISQPVFVDGLESGSTEGWDTKS